MLVSQTELELVFFCFVFPFFLFFLSDQKGPRRGGAQRFIIAQCGDLAPARGHDHEVPGRCGGALPDRGVACLGEAE